MDTLQITSFEQLPAGLTFISRQLAELNERLNTQPASTAGADHEKIYTRQQTADRLSVSLPTLNEYTKDGKITGSRFGRRVLYKESDIQAALKKIQTSVAA